MEPSEHFSEAFHQSIRPCIQDALPIDPVSTSTFTHEEETFGKLVEREKTPIENDELHIFVGLKLNEGQQLKSLALTKRTTFSSVNKCHRAQDLVKLRPIYLLPIYFVT